jgi:hypothetical protein
MLFDLKIYLEKKKAIIQLASNNVTRSRSKQKKKIINVQWQVEGPLLREWLAQN